METLGKTSNLSHPQDLLGSYLYFILRDGRSYRGKLVALDSRGYLMLTDCIWETSGFR